MSQKQTQGRRKIEMKKIEKDDNLLITFSKRRAGIYKKATELSTLCGAEVGVLVFSPAGKAFTYGIPNIETIANRFLQSNVSHVETSSTIFEAHRDLRVNEYNMTHDELVAHLEVLKKKGQMLVEMKREVQEHCWWDAPIEDLSPKDMQQFRASMEELKRVAPQKIQELFVKGASSSSTAPSTMAVVDPVQMNYQFPHFDGSTSSAALGFGDGFWDLYGSSDSDEDEADGADDGEGGVGGDVNDGRNIE
ncbi:hypothetical protein Ancab_018298 [Ancistrocladus abbreviatus]